MRVRERGHLAHSGGAILTAMHFAGRPRRLRSGAGGAPALPVRSQHSLKGLVMRKDLALPNGFRNAAAMALSSLEAMVWVPETFRDTVL